ncbi:MAG: endonuclease [Proteobacteria bacterium]|nr:endonuclease [Pseudomonadota bacterium]
MKHGNAVRLVSTKDMSREKWLSVRNGGIGSSDAAAAIGLSPYKSPLELWLEKTGRKEPEDLSEKEAVFWGSTLEPILAAVYQQRTGNKVRRVNAVLQHPTQSFMLANLDRAVGYDGILEVKTASYHSGQLWEETVPEAYQCQVLHQLAVTGKAWADVAVLIGGQDFRIYRIERDEEKIFDLIDLETGFWQCVKGDVPPPVDGSESSGRALNWMYPQDSSETIDCTDSNQLNRLFCELLDMKRRREQLEFLEATHKQTIQSAMGNATTALFVGGKVSWKKPKDSQGVDLKRLLADNPALAAQYAITTPGTRRFLMQIEKPVPNNA